MVRTQPIAFLKLFLLYLCNCVIKVLNKPKIIHTMYKYLLSWKAKWSWTNHSEFECAIMSLSSQKNALSLLLIWNLKKAFFFIRVLFLKNWHLPNLTIAFNVYKEYQNIHDIRSLKIPIWEHEYNYFGSYENLFNIDTYF